MRVIAGELGGRRLHAPAGDRTRPTSDRVREALFMALGPLDGVRVVDLYAGSGSEAEQFAGVMKNPAKLFYLVPKPEFLNSLRE